MKRWFTFVLGALIGCAHVSSEALGDGQYEVECKRAGDCYKQANVACKGGAFDVLDSGIETRAASRVGTTYVAHNRTTLLIQCRAATTPASSAQAAPSLAVAR